MSELLQSLNIPTLKFTPCKVKLSDDMYLDTYSSPSFEFYKQSGNYIIDTKCPKSSIWPHDNSLSLFPANDNKMDLSNWIEIITPLLNDLNILADNGLSLSSDTLNLVFVSKDSSWHSSSDSPFEIRLFGFDFASKNHKLDISNRKPLKYIQVYRMLEKFIEYSVWEELAPNDFSHSEDKVKFWEELLNVCKII